MKVLSLYDGMACGMLAMQRAEIPVDGYYAYEIDKYAIKTALHNFPGIQELGDVFKEDYTKYEGQIDYLIGGSPCTYWSIAQSPDKRETTSSGIGWDLFSQYVRALQEAKPKYFIYENNKSMARAIYEAISETFGFEPICINSALVSAQNRQRLYWVGKRNADGIYSKVDVEQPEDRGILLRDVLDSADLTNCDKAYCLTSSYDGACAWNTIERHQRSMVAEPVNTTIEGKSQTLKAQYSNTDINNICRYTSTYGAGGVAEPVPVMSSVQVGALPRPNGELSQSQAFGCYDTNAKSVTLKAGGGGAGGKTGLYAMPILPIKEATKKGYTEIQLGNCFDYEQPNSKTRRGRNMLDKTNCLTTHCNFYQYFAYAIEFNEEGKPTKAISAADGKTYTVYEVKDGTITIKGKTYPIKLVDGYYIIRKLTVTECKRLQTVPEWYEFPVSNTQSYKMLGNGWTVEVIAHLINATKNT